jgi:geranylgeranyl diphosphate synthase type II
MSFNEQLRKKVEEVEVILEKVLPEATGYQKNIMGIMEYSLMSGGKRIRPILMKEAFNLFNEGCTGAYEGAHKGGCSDAYEDWKGINNELVEPFMAAIEMIHTYSLVHDDLPAMDNDEYRRGRKTTWMVYGEDMGILAGDALLNYAFETATTAFEISPDKSALIGQALQVLAHKGGIHGMIGGQVIDIESAGVTISKEVLDRIYTLKTAALMEASMMIGGILGGATQEEVKKLESIARDVGMAFQIQDDILDVTSTFEVLGKAINSDEKNEKTTYVTLKSLEEAREDVKNLSNQAIKELKSLGRDTSFLEKLLLSLIYRKS